MSIASDASYRDGENMGESKAEEPAGENVRKGNVLSHWQFRCG